jgi:transcriptional regulator with XRE-family HTH domain|nr:helix-turn-helix transcriptional regulator [uncultured Blautia sp.]
MQYFDKREMGFRIKYLRHKEGMTQHELAEQLCYSTERQLQRIESGETACPVERLMEIAQVLHTSTDYILFGKAEPVLVDIGNDGKGDKVKLCVLVEVVNA